MVLKFSSLITFLALTFDTPAFATWTANLGYQNPPNAQYGLNLFYYSMDWGFEIGVGWADIDTIDTDDPEDDSELNDDRGEDSAKAAILGGANLKYFLLGSKFKLYGQLGMGLGAALTAGKRLEASSSIGGGYGGLGLMFGGPKLYIYGSYNINRNDNSFLQAGLGFDI